MGAGAAIARKGAVVSQRRVYLVLFATLFFGMSYTHQKRFDVATPPSRLDLLHALVIHGTVSIDAYHENTPDKAVHGGRYYSDKAPGTVVLAFPAFSFAAGVLAIDGISLDSEKGWLVSSWAACGGSLALLASLGGVALFAWLTRWTPPRIALLTTVTIFLGAAPLVYATMMFSHSLVVGLLAVALWAIQRQSEVDSGRRYSPAAPDALAPSETAVVSESSSATSTLWNRVRSAGRGLLSGRWDLLAGFACGWVLASEYTAGLIVVGIGFLVLRMGWGRITRLTLASVPPVLLIPAYSWLCLADPFTLPYSHQASFPAMQEGLYAIEWPDPTTAFNLLLSPTRGLFFWSPFLVMAGLGYWELADRSRAWFWITYALPLLQIIVISGRTWDWQAGFTVGPRYLAPILPLLALPCALGLRRFPKTGGTLALISVLMTTLATLTDATPDYSIYNPLTELHLPLLAQGVISPNVGVVLGLPAYSSVVVYYVIIAIGVGWLWKKVELHVGFRDLREGKPAKGDI